MKKLFFSVLLVLIFTIFSSTVFSAKISGTVYSLSLEKVNNAKVEINTVPKQVVVVEDSSYEFFVPQGVYEIKASQIVNNHVEAATTEQVTVKDEGEYVLDLILFPSDGYEILDDEIEFDEELLEERKNPIFLILGLVLLFVVLVLFIVFIKKYKSKKEEKTEEVVEQPEISENDLDKIINIIKEEGGRTTQKEIRKKIPYSEAKISLMIAELENKGTIKKIKKGRGNIIVLNKENEA